jgi:hypothetical protein
MEYRLQVAGISRETGRERRVTLKFNAEGELLNAIALARSGIVGWGAWQQSHKVKCALGKCWSCSTAGHGGFILITQEPVSFKEPAFEVQYAFPTGPAVKVYAYEFEEDCDWSLLLDNDPQAFESEVAHRLTWCEAGKNIDDIRQELKDAVAKSRQWSKDYAEAKAIEQKLLDEGKFLRCAAAGKDTGTWGEDTVVVTFRNKDRQELYRSMSKETYHAIPYGVSATIEDYAKFGKVELAEEKDA